MLFTIHITLLIPFIIITTLLNQLRVWTISLIFISLIFFDKSVIKFTFPFDQ
jgi:hypothetical protein